MPSPPNHKWPSLFPPAVVLGLFVVCFAGVIFQDRLFAFRDAARFYYPLFSLIQQMWETGQVPWYNPYENGGMPIWSNPAASLFYPGKLIFFAIGDFNTAYRVYILAHVLLAAFWAYRLARHWSASRPAATLATIAYTFSGAVLIQYSNVIFLIGATWLPAGVLAADRMLRHRRKRDAVFLGIVCALVTLGGDPQTAYHLGLLTLLLIMLRGIRRRSLGKNLAAGLCNKKLAAGLAPAFRQGDVVIDHAKTSPAANRLETNHTTSLAKLLTITLLTGFALATIQIVPTVRYLLTTDRVQSHAALSLYDVPRVIGTDDAGRQIADGLLCRNLDRPGHPHSLYQFSVGPWRFAELVWPNCYGRQFPLHRRWIQVLPGEGRAWTPTLYAGILPLGFAIGAFRLRRRKKSKSKQAGATSRRWMSWTLLLGLVGSLGYYGIVWMVEEIVGRTPQAGAPVGGLYWLMTVVLPGYVYFRYPAKLLVLVSLGLAMLAARGWDDFFARRRARTDRIFLGIMVSSLIVLAVFAISKPLWTDWVSTTRACTMFGPLDVEGAFRDTLFGLGQAVIVSGIAWFFLRFLIVGGSRVNLSPCTRVIGDSNAGTSPAANNVGMWLLVILAALDLGLANHWLVVTAPAELWQTRSPILTEKSVETTPVIQVYRRPNFLNPAWKEQGSTDRLAEAVVWDCMTLAPKYNLLQQVGVVNSYGTMLPATYRERLQGTPVEVMRTTGATIAILPQDEVLPDGECLLVDKDFGFSVWRLKEKE